MTNMEWLVNNKINIRDLYVTLDSDKGGFNYLIKDYNAIVYSEFKSDTANHSKVLLEWLAADYERQHFLSESDKKLLRNWLTVIRSFTWNNIIGISLTRFDADGDVVDCFDNDEKVDGYYIVFDFEGRDSVKFLTSDNDFKRMKWNKKYSLYDLDMTGIDEDLEKAFNEK